MSTEKMESEELHEMIEWDPEKGVVRSVWMTERTINENFMKAREFYEQFLKENNDKKS